MKVLLCSPLTGKVGGISLWTKHIVNYFSQHDTHEHIDLFDTVRKYDIYPDTPTLERVAKGIEDYRSIVKGVKKKFKKEQYDIIHLVSSGSLSLIKDYFILKWAKRKKVQTVLHFHFGRIPEILATQNWENKLLKKVLSKADKIIVIDSISFRYLKKEGFKNVFFLANPLSPHIIETISHNSNIVRKANKIMFAGNVIPTKGIFELIEACGPIENVEVHILGAISTEIYDEVKKKTESMPAVFHIAGEVSQEKIIQEMLSSRIFVLPSYTEGFPNVILESMAAGCCIVATDVGAIPEMLDGDAENACGIVVKAKDAKDLQRAIREVLNDETVAENLRNNAINKVNKSYSIDIISNQLRSIWNS